MIELPVDPIWGKYLILGIVTMFAGMGVALILTIQYDKFVPSLFALFGGVTLGFVIVTLFHQPLIDEYENEMKELINNVDCTKLEYIAEHATRSKFNDEAITEIITRCIPGEHTPKLLELIRKQ